MATIEQRVADLEYLLAHLPEDLDARFAGLHTKLAEIREAAAVHTHRLALTDGRVEQLGMRLSRVESAVSELGTRFVSLEASVGEISRLLQERLPPRT